MAVARRQGRPKTGESSVGVERIMSSCLEAIRRGDITSFSRLEIARAIGVTPALLTYYFPKGSDVVRGCVEGCVLDRCGTVLSALRDASLPRGEVLVEVTEAMLALFGSERLVVRRYEEMSRTGTIASSLLDEVRGEMALFFSGWLAENGRRSPEPDVLVDLLWGAWSLDTRTARQRAEIVKELALGLCGEGMDTDAFLGRHGASASTKGVLHAVS